MTGGKLAAPLLSRKCEVAFVVFAFATICTGRAASCCCGIEIDSGCSRFKSDGAKEPVILVLGEFVVLDDTAMEGIIGEERAAPGTFSAGERTVPFGFTIVETVRVVAAAASTQHQSPVFQVP
uniref:Secreted protein n=1 Tax=Pseudo-nitzschia australis TaxID=44445 RepID=A0A7S4EGY9_9STRA